METSQSLNCAPPALFAAPRKQPEFKKWDGSGRTDVRWDGLRRDADLWFPQGDCLVYLYKKGMSKRGPSFCIPYRIIRAAACDTTLFIDAHILCSGQSTPSSSSDESSASGSQISTTNKLELFLGVPNVDRDQKLHWHITTRNFFAWLVGEPLVGEDLGMALQHLLERLRVYRGDAFDNIQGLLEYAQKIGYLNFVGRPDHALALLLFAETHQIQSLYVDAFAHCVGMKDRLEDCSGFKHISSLSKALITRAYLEMDLHVERAALSLGNFMDEELSSSHLGLGRGARAHLDTFRSFLHTYCVAKYGYWPPSSDSSSSRVFYQSMQQDFQALYDGLANNEAAKDFQLPQPASGGICVLQNIEAFNNRHKYQPLPYSTPLMPLISAPDDAVYGHRNRRTSWFGFNNGNNNNHSEIQRMEVVRTALSIATNREDVAVATCPLVQAYVRFESEQASACDENISVSDARKVRWILIYTMLQTITSVMHAPPDVKMAAATPYPLCCLTTGTPPWKTGSVIDRTSKSSIPSSAESSALAAPTPEIDIRPDCEYNDYFHHLRKQGSGHGHTQSNPSNSNLQHISLTSTKSLHMLLRRNSTRSPSPGHIAPPPVPARNRGNRRSTMPALQAQVKLHRETPLPELPWIETNDLRSSIPALDWSPDLHDRADSSSDDDNSSPDTDHLGRFPSIDPYHVKFWMPNFKSDKDIPDAKVRNSLDTIFDDFLHGSDPFTGMAV